MKAPNMIEGYLSKYNDTNEEYIVSIGDLFKNYESLLQIQKTMELHFPIDAQDFISQPMKIYLNIAMR